MIKLVLRIAIVSALITIPMISLAVAKGEQTRSMTGAGFVLYVSLQRP
ncbi:MAG: hypothetical protein AAGI92_06910 [Pseudomonadota bacterium]